MIQLIYKDRHFIQGFIISSLFSIILLAIRVVTVKSEFFLFLIWNLFLACIPYGITLILSLKQIHKNHLFFWLGFIIWLLFLPNAPYILTDLQHLRVSSLQSIWFDVLLIISFAINGLLIGFVSIYHMKQLLLTRFTHKTTSLMIYSALLLCGFGIYLGRVLRWNSWDIIEHPLKIYTDIATRITQPAAHIHTWAFTFGFGSFLIIIYLLFNTIKKQNKI